MSSKYTELQKENFKKKFKKILVAIVIPLILIQSVLASIGVSSLTGDYNYFLFTVGGMVVIGIALVISALIMLTKRKIKAFSKQ